jgi:drug/metabolite transporter (DMT)-like permease
LDPFILSGFVSAFLASLFWMAAMTKFSLSFAYPFMSSAFVIVMFFSILLFGETLNIYKIIGTGLIVLGIIVLSQGYAV